MAAINQNYRITEKAGKAVIVDLDGNVVPPGEAARIAQSLIETTTEKSYVYFATDGRSGIFKIGFTHDLARRKAELGVEYEHVIECDSYGEYSAPKIELALHNLFGNVLECRVEREWFLLTGMGMGLIADYCIDGRSTMRFIEQALENIDKVISANQEYGVNAFAMVCGSRFAGGCDKVLFACAWMYYRILSMNLNKEGHETEASYIGAVMDTFLGYIKARQGDTAPFKPSPDTPPNGNG